MSKNFSFFFSPKKCYIILFLNYSLGDHQTEILNAVIKLFLEHT